ncbi:MAG TPA: histidine phosphatase family protein [Planctomycetota bacterium]|nr:histidine phosphatase family protein [Planctomycetota bacterium]
MATTFILARHGAHLLGGATIAGRSAGVQLSPLGIEQSQQLAERLSHLPIRAIYSSPLERTHSTAEFLARRLELPVQADDSFSEIDFGEWTRRKLDELRPQPLWKQWNAFRSGTRSLNGESMAETQFRIMTRMMRLREQHPNDCIAIFSHGDVIKAAVAYFLGVPLDLFQRIEIGLASASVISIGDYGPRVQCVNNQGSIVLQEE